MDGRGLITLRDEPMLFRSATFMVFDLAISLLVPLLAAGGTGRGERFTGEGLGGSSRCVGGSGAILVPERWKGQARHD